MKDPASCGPKPSGHAWTVKKSLIDDVSILNLESEIF
jgi:hypothetical protein